MKYNIRRLLYSLMIILFLIPIGEIFGQNISPKDVININVKSKKILHKNEVIKLGVILNIKDGWHINANKPLDNYLTPTVLSLKDTSEVEIIGIQYPTPSYTKLKFSQTELALYENEIEIHLELKLKKNFKKNSLKLIGEIQYQPCNDQTCLFPSSKQFNIDLHFKK